MAIQNHIHLYKVGDAPKQWSVLELQKDTNIFATAKVTLSGKLYSTMFRNTLGDVVKTNDIDLLIIVQDEEIMGKTYEERLADLEEMYGEMVYYVPNNHIESPLGPIITAQLLNVGTESPFTKALTRYHIPVKLKKGDFV